MRSLFLWGQTRILILEIHSMYYCGQNPPLLPLKVRDLRLDLEQNRTFFKGLINFLERETGLEPATITLAT